MEREELIPWSDVTTPVCPALDKVLNTAAGLEVIVGENLALPERYSVKFNLKDLVSFTVTNDSFAWRLAAERPNPGGSLIYMVKNSTLLRYFSEQTEGVTDMSAATHYYLVTSEDVIDVVSFSAPDVSASMR